MTDTTRTPVPVFSADRFRAWAHVRGVAMEVLADAAGTSTAYVRACQYGHPSAATPAPAVVTVWARVLGCAVAELCSRTPQDAAEYWRGADAALGPMSAEQVHAIAAVLDRTARRRTRPRQRPPRQ